MKKHPTFNSWADLYDMSHQPSGFTDIDEITLMREFFYMSDPNYVNGIVEYLDIMYHPKEDTANGVYSLLVTYQINIDSRLNTKTYIVRGNSYDALLLDLFQQSYQTYRMHLKHGLF